MAIRIIDGVPGSGKSFYAVRHLLNKYFKYDSEVDDYEQIKSCVIITNIEDFKLDHVSLKEEINVAGGVKEFFALEYQDQYRHQFGDNTIVYMIDEAQMMFRRQDRTLKDIFSYFEYHRHFGQDIYLITQNSKKLPTDIVDLVEYIVRARPRVRSIVGELKYKWISDGEILKHESFKPDPKVFMVYKSMDKKESEKIKNPVMKTVAFTFLAIIIVFGIGLYKLKNFFYPDDANHLSEVEVDSKPKSSNYLIVRDNVYSTKLDSNGIKTYVYRKKTE